MITKPPDFRCKNCAVFGATVWAELQEDERACVERQRQMLFFKRNSILFRQGDRSKGLYCVESGHIVLETIDPFGNEAIFAVLGPGQATGYRSFLSDSAHAATARAIDAATVCFVPVEPIMKLLEANPGFSLKTLRMVASDPGANVTWTLRNPNYSVQTRILHFLILFRNEFSTSQPDGSAAYHIPLRRRELAAMLGARTETIIRAMSELNRLGIVSFRGKTANVPDLKLLEEFCQAGM